MTEVTEAYQSVLTQLRDWRRIAEKDRLDLLRIATSLMGRHFREAMAIIEKGPSYLQIYDLDLFYVLVMPTDKFLLFKSSSRLKQNDCSCLQSWQRKVGECAAYLCMHQIVLELATSVYAQMFTISRGDLSNDGLLGELLDFVNSE